jgi:phospholipase C
MVRCSLLPAASVFAGLAFALPNNDPRNQAPSWKSNIKNVVVLVEENRSYDTILGGQVYRGDLNNFSDLSSPFCNPV